MRRVVLSRKGFDSSPQGGGSASPIFEDGRIFSMPIPEPYPPSPKKYKDLYFNGVSGIDALKECTITTVSSQSFCHYDPALNKDEVSLGSLIHLKVNYLTGKSVMGIYFFFLASTKNSHLKK